ncbi:hypothetical protein [Neptuniibacter sp. QD37_11]|uniref:hypothetical protein n=1 Tax=Neptuniibacter sp. QD37_11 TaxID=3398209 RepID=UPI0039F586CA
MRQPTEEDQLSRGTGKYRPQPPAYRLRGRYWYGMGRDFGRTPIEYQGDAFFTALMLFSMLLILTPLLAPIVITMTYQPSFTIGFTVACLSLYAMHSLDYEGSPEINSKLALYSLLLFCSTLFCTVIVGVLTLVGIY